jgi:polysaccharide export outer membrane protein
MNYKILKILLFVLFINSCIGVKDINYLQPNSNLELNEEGLVSRNIEKYKLQVDDIISVNLTSLDPDALKFLIGGNQGQSQSQGQGQALGNAFYLTGNRIDGDGKLHVLGLGSFNVAGKTIEEAEKEIGQKLKQTTYKDNISEIKIRLEGINFTVLGEVKSPGAKTIRRINVNLLDAIAASGDLEKLADRKNIIIIRQYSEGNKRVNIDITREDIQNSPYFWLQPNDYIIVNSRKEKMTGFGANTWITDITQSLSLAVSSISLFLFIQNLSK